MILALLFRSFFNMISTHFNTKIKVFRSNNAPKLTFYRSFNDKGVIHQFSCVEWPQQYLVVERKHHHLLNVARALYFNPEFQFNFGVNVFLRHPFSSIEHLLLYSNIVLLMISYTKIQHTLISRYLDV